jgi:hypothetical protein
MDVRPIVPIERVISAGYAPPPIENPFLFGVTILMKEFELLSDDTTVIALPDFTLLS